MATDYLSIPGKSNFSHLCVLPHLLIMCLASTSIDVEQMFSQGRLLLSHLCSWLSVQSTCTLLCLGVRSAMGYVKDDDIKSAAVLPEVDGDEEDLADNWDSL